MRRFSALLISAISALAFTPIAFAADMATKAPPPPAPVPFTWTGFYVGATVGGIWGRSQHCDTSAFCTASFNVDGATGGGTLGYNYQMNNNWVVGLETDISASGAKGTTLTVPGTFSCLTPDCYTDLDWFGTVRGRIGPVFNSNLLPYVTGGYAYGGLKAGLGTLPPPTGLSASGTESGWTAGGGIEYALPVKHWSVKLEYLYVRLGNLFYDTAHICGGVSCTAVHNDFNVLRLGANYHF